jgi:hypothetical protein
MAGEAINLPGWRRLWEGWKAIAHAIGTFQARWILAFLYLVLVGPVALIRRLGGADPLGVRPGPGTTYWRPRPPETPSLDAARRQ